MSRSFDVGKARYHHGDLRTVLLHEAEAMLREQGLEGLSLRKLAARAEVSPTALYHHFEDKHALLCALAERGFAQLEAQTVAAAEAPASNQHARVLAFVRAYVGFARQNPVLYDLLFGRLLWKAGVPSARVRDVAFGTFRRYLEHAIPRELVSPRSLRIAQVGWATLHGLCRQLIDGIYVRESDIDALCEAVADALLLARRRMGEPA